jgi:hypothetical protein
MADIKPLGEIASKYVRRASAAAEDYVGGVQRAGPQKWEAQAVAAQDNWAQGVQEAVARGAFAQGVQGQGPRWLGKIQAFGRARYPQGVGAAEQDYSRGFQPYHSAIQGLTLPPRGPRGDERNFERVRVIGRTLNQVRTRGG